MEDYTYFFKVLSLGDSGVGKSCIIKSYVDRTFNPLFISTIGVDFVIKEVERDSKKAKLQIWDTAGQERFRTIVSSYYRGAHGVILVYDVTNPASLANISNWMADIQRYANANVQIIMLANKTDLPNRAVSCLQGQALASSYGIPHFEVTATRPDCLDGSFDSLTNRMINSYHESQRVMADDKVSALRGHGARTGLVRGSDNGKRSSDCCQ